MGNPLIYPFALCWGLFDLFFITKFNAASHGMFPHANLFVLFHMAPVWYAIFSPIYRFFNWYRIDYALTDKRLYFTAGIIGLDIASLELPEVHNLRVYVGILEAIFQRGTIRFGNRNALYAIEKPYEVYKLIQQTAVDISTDRQFPNQLRPDENPGYRTRYKP
ncbi:PH domain-containing protein [Eikenella sp. S3360]|uniref:PH domain-containing protein n=2 Tax=Eikenella glucosivorans TaxID=2766967 RepID=A0ABS0N721_9NEIS|nr:PH domain-containing protein [Eikenella glucosivorans]